MGVYWNAASYKKDESYITGEVKCRGFYEFNIKKAASFSTGNYVEFRGGVYLFEQLLTARSISEYGLQRIGDLFFYFDSDDWIDGSNIRMLDTEYNDMFGMLVEPIRVFATLQGLATATDNFNSIHFDADFNSVPTQKVELQRLLEILADAVDNNYLMHFHRS